MASFLSRLPWTPSCEGVTDNDVISAQAEIQYIKHGLSYNAGSADGTDDFAPGPSPA